jgi:hypothetical protein
MKIIRTLLFIGVTFVASGCATNSQQEIDHYARLFYFSNLCSKASMMDREVAAKGIAIANSNIYRSDTPRYQARAKQMWDAGERPTETTCRDIDLLIRAGS